MRILDLIWSPSVIDKLDWKHGVVPEEVEEAFIVSARDMDGKERKRYEREKNP